MSLYRVLALGILFFLVLTIQISEAMILTPTTVTVTVEAEETADIQVGLIDDAAFSWVAGANQTWLAMSPADGDGEAMYAVTVTVDAGGLTPGGTYSGQVMFVSPSEETVTLDVTLSVTEESLPGQLVVNPSAVDLDVAKDVPPQEFRLSVVDGFNGSRTFSWSVSASANWLEIDSPGPFFGPGAVVATVNASALDPGPYEATLTFYTNLSESAEPVEVPVRITVAETLDRAQDLSFSTSAWFDLSFVDLDTSVGGRLFLLLEHPQLVPGQVYAYHHDVNGARIDLFSQWGGFTPQAFDYAYATNAQGVSSVNIGGFRLIGLEGDLTVRIVAGPSLDELEELERRVIHVVPLTGEWEVSDHYYGQWYNYPDPLIIWEERGLLSSEWADVYCDVAYGNPDDIDEYRLEISGSRISLQGADFGNAAYTMHVTRQWAEFLYEVNWLEPLYLEGIWQFRWLGTEAWSVPQRFAAIRTDVDISDVLNTGNMPGQRGEVEIGLHWSNYNDLDLHVIDPSGEEIYYASPVSASGGELDVDANAGCSGNQTQDAWEHVVWVQDPSAGEYKVQVKFFDQCDGAPMQSTFQVVVKIGTEESVYTGSVSTVGETVDVTTFEY